MKGNKLAGLFLILFGILYLTLQVLDQMNIVLFNFWDFWPLTIICVGLLFEAGYFYRKKAPGLLIPGGILSTIGFLFLFETLTNWRFSNLTWPIYTFAVFVGFFQLWLATKSRGAGVVATILFTVFAFLVFISVSILVKGYASADLSFSIVLIIVGVILLVTSRFWEHHT